MNWGRTLAGGALGAVAGCGLWIGVAWVTGYEIGILAIIVGLTIGIGTALGAQGRAGTAGGIAAGAMTVVAIVVARGVVVQMSVSQMLREAMAEGISEIPGPEDDAYWTAYIADRMIEDDVAAGGDLDWADSDDPEESVESFYPPEVWERAAANWERLSAADRAEFCSLATKQIILEGEEGMGDAQFALGVLGNLVSNFHPMALLIMGISVATAFKTARDSQPKNGAAEGAATMSATATTMEPAMTSGFPALPREATEHASAGAAPGAPKRPVKSMAKLKPDADDEAAISQLPPWLRPPKE